MLSRLRGGGAGAARATGGAAGGPGGGDPEARRRTAVLLLSTMASFLTPFMGSAVNIALPSIGEEFSMDAVLLSWVATGYLVTAAIFLVPFGRVADIRGRKRVFTWGMVVFSAVSLLLGFAPSGGFVVAMRLLQGVGAAMIFGTGVAMLTSVYPPGQRGKVLGINVASVYVGLTLGPFIGGVLTEQLGWRWVFLINVPLGALVVAATVWGLRGEEWAGARGERLDVTGAVIYGATIAAIIVGFSLLPDLQGVALVLAGMLGLGLFAAWGTWSASPILDLNLFWRNRVFAFSNLAALIHYSATFAVAFLLSLYLQLVKGLGPQEAGLVILVQPVLQAAFSPLAGRLSDTVEPRLVASAGMAMTTVGLVVLVFLTEGTRIPSIALALTLLGIGFAFFSSPNTNAVMGSVSRRFYGSASGTIGTMRLIGQTLSMGLATLLFALYIGHAEITASVHGEFLGAMRAAMAIFSVLCFLGIFASMARGRVHGAEGAEAPAGLAAPTEA